VAYGLTREAKYLDAARNTAAYYTGGNPLNMMWISNFGHRYPRQLFHMDCWLRPDRNPEFFPGIVPYGPMDPKRDWMTNNGPHASGWAADRAYPDYRSWPGHELYFDNRYCPPTNEFTVHQNTAVAAAVYGSLCGTAPASFAPNARPTVSLLAPEEGASFRQGDTLEVRFSSADPDGRVAYTECYADHHFIGRTEGGSVKWGNAPAGTVRLIAVAVDNRGRRSLPDTVRVSVKRAPSPSSDRTPGGPYRFALFQNFPNPFNPDTVVRYQVPETSSVKVSVFDAAGNEVRTLEDRVRAAGGYSVAWDGTDGSGRCVGSGMYFCRIKAAGAARAYQETRKMVLAR
jgi:hypothetical protein